MSRSEVAVFGGGCFWCSEALFKELKGVVSVTPGYAGGITQNPSYTGVSSGATGHAEVIKVEFDPQIIPYADLLDIFFHTHDPTSLNRQGADVGTHYRSIILYTNDTQQKQAAEFIDKLKSSHEFEKPIVTEVKKLETFYEAESYHLNYYEKNSFEPYCQLIISPKLHYLRQKYSSKVR